MYIKVKFVCGAGRLFGVRYRIIIYIVKRADGEDILKPVAVLLDSSREEEKE
jgi:hypothetical protein